MFRRSLLPPSSGWRPGDGGILWYVSQCLLFVVVHPRWQESSYSLQWESQFSSTCFIFVRFSITLCLFHGYFTFETPRIYRISSISVISILIMCFLAGWGYSYGRHVIPRRRHTCATSRRSPSLSSSSSKWCCSIKITHTEPSSHSHVHFLTNM